MHKDPNNDFFKGWLALHFADYNGHSDIVSELIRRGTDVDSVTTKVSVNLKLANEDYYLKFMFDATLIV